METLKGKNPSIFQIKKILNDKGLKFWINEVCPETGIMLTSETFYQLSKKLIDQILEKYILTTDNDGLTFIEAGTH